MSNDVFIDGDVMKMGKTMTSVCAHTDVNEPSSSLCMRGILSK